MIRRVIGRVCVAVWLGCIAATAGQLPPEIQVDRYLLRADRLMEAKDPKGALEVMGKIVALQKEHGLTLPEEFHFKHAKVAFSAGEVQEAVDAVHTYLLDAGREGKFYREALELLEEAEQREQLQSWIGTDKTCAGQPKGSACWMELTGPAGLLCLEWLPLTRCHRDLDGHVFREGGPKGRERSSGSGKMARKLRNLREASPTARSTASGSFAKRTETSGKAPMWTARGTASGSWRERTETSRKAPMWTASCTASGFAWRTEVSRKAPMWTARGTASGSFALRTETSVQEGPYVDGKSCTASGWSVIGGRNGVQEGPCGRQEARPVGGALADGGVQEGYVDGKRHGQWVQRWADGTVGRPLCGRQEHGQWVLRWADGRVEHLTYEDGEEVRRSSRRQTGSAAAGRGRCQVPGYPNPPGGVSNLGFSWCPASVGLQVRSFALQAAGAECAIATGSSSTPEQIEARRREIRAACDRLSALGQGNCQCPAGLGQ